MVNLYKAVTRSIKYWYIPMIVGIAFFAFGIYILTVPLQAYTALAVVFSFSFLFSGLFDSYFAIQNHKSLQGWGWHLVGGLFTLLMGLYLVMNPGISMVLLPFVVGFTLLFRSFQLLGFAFDLKDSNMLDWGNVALASMLGIIVSFMLLASPLFTGVSIVSMTSLAFIFSGIASFFLALDLRKIKTFPQRMSKKLSKKIQEVEKEIEKELDKLDTTDFSDEE